MINKETYKRLTKVHIAKDGDGSGFETGTKWVEKLSQDGDILHRLAELEDKIENGTLLELPCKVGDTVYYVGEKIYEAQIKKIIYDLGHMAFDNRAINQSIFLTQEAAEARLKELREENKQ